MPLIQIAVAGPAPSPATIQRLQLETTHLMRDVLHKEAALTVVGVSHLPPSAVAAAGVSVGSAAWLQGLITAGTNSDAEKAAFIGAAEAMLVEALGDLSAPIYVCLHELPATDWGYDGRTQAARRQECLAGGAA
jgi:4-oxalocrotonate tautomerase